MKLNQLTTLLAVLATLLFATACEEEAAADTPAAQTGPSADETTEGEPAAEEAQPAQEAQAEQPAQADEAAGGGGGGACDRAQTCCEAYVADMIEMAGGSAPGVSVETTCGSIAATRSAPGGDGDCEQMITGWRTALETSQRTVPASCAAQ
jgi:hypothetical protein